MWIFLDVEGIVLRHSEACVILRHSEVLGCSQHSEGRSVISGEIGDIPVRSVRRIALVVQYHCPWYVIAKSMIQVVADLSEISSRSRDVHETRRAPLELPGTALSLLFQPLRALSKSSLTPPLLCLSPIATLLKNNQQR